MAEVDISEPLVVDNDYLRRTLAANPPPGIKEDGESRRMTFIGQTTYRMEQESPAEGSVINGICQLEKGLSKEDIVSMAKEKFLIYPRFRSIVTEKDGKLYWTEVEDVDWDYHVVERELDIPYDQSAIDNYISKLTESTLDMDRPLFRFYIFKNFKSDNASCALLTRIHHSIADGTTLLQVFFSMMEEVDPSTKQEGLGVSKRHPPSIISQITNPLTLSNRLYLLAEGVFSALAITVLPGDTQTLLKPKSVKELSIKRVMARSKNLPLETIKAIKNDFGGTVNDVIVALVTAAVRRYLKSRNDPHAISGNAKIRGIFPYNMRKGKFDIRDPKSFGNQFTFIPITFPIGIEDRVELLRECKALCDDLKQSPQALVMMKLNELAGKILPPEKQVEVVETLMDKITINFTNVPGPQRPMQIMGSRIQDIMFYVPGPNGTVLSVISYNGNCSLGIICDPKLVPDPQAFADCFSEEVDALRDAIVGKEIPPTPPITFRVVTRMLFFVMILLLTGLAPYYFGAIAVYYGVTFYLAKKDKEH